MNVNETVSKITLTKEEIKYLLDRLETTKELNNIFLTINRVPNDHENEFVTENIICKNIIKKIHEGEQ